MRSTALTAWCSSSALVDPLDAAFGLALDRIDRETEMITVDQQVVIIDRRSVLAPPKTSASLYDVPMS